MFRVLLIASLLFTLGRCDVGEKHRPEHCVGDSIDEGNQFLLGRNAAICKGDWRFGLSHKGYLGLWDGNSMEWDPNKRGDRAVVQTNEANFVLYRGGSDKWATDCPNADDNGKLEIESDGTVTLYEQGNNVLWRLESDGTNGCL